MNLDLPQTDMTAEIQFRSRNEANDFAIAYTRHTLMGHSISPDFKVKVWNVTKETMQFIDAYVNKLNN